MFNPSPVERDKIQNMSKSSHIRSISLPGSSHPSIQKVEEELSKLKTFEISASPAAATICSDLLRLEQIFKCMDDILQLPQTLQVLSQYHNKKWVDDLLEKSVKLLDIFGFARNTISNLKEHLRDLQSSLRRRKGDVSIQSSIKRYTYFRKNMNKDAKRLIASSKKTDAQTETSTPVGMDHDVRAVIEVLREASAVSISIFHVVMVFLSTPVLKPKPSRWSIVSNLVQKGRIACDNQQGNMSNLETLEVQLEAIEDKLESMFRCLIKSRSSLLNIVSC